GEDLAGGEREGALIGAQGGAGDMGRPALAQMQRAARQGGQEHERGGQGGREAGGGAAVRGEHEDRGRRGGPIGVRGAPAGEGAGGGAAGGGGHGGRAAGRHGLDHIGGGAARDVVHGPATRGAAEHAVGGGDGLGIGQQGAELKGLADGVLARWGRGGR